MQNQNLAPTPLPQRTPAVPEGLSAELAASTGVIDPAVTHMEGWFREVTLTGGDRRPLKDTAEVTQQWGLPLGTEVGKIILPGRDKPADLPIEADPEVTMPFQRVSSPEAVEDQSLRTLHVFDARTSEHAPPHFVVASQSALRRIAATPPLFRGLVARLSRDVQHIYEGEHLQVGAKEGRWLPSLLRRQEKKIQARSGQHAGRPVISGEQTLFYVGDDRELHVRSEGYNADTLVAHPNEVETQHAAEKKAYEKGMSERIAKARRTKEQYIAQAATTHLNSAKPTTYVSRHASDTPTKVGV